jgi:hypothetical protein
MRRNWLNNRWYVTRGTVESLVTLAATWGTAFGTAILAYNERGYKALGGEYLVTLAVTYATYKLIHHIFDVLEVRLNEHFEKEYLREHPGYRNRRRNVRESLVKGKEETIVPFRKGM